MPYFKLPDTLMEIAKKQGGYLLGSDGQYPFNDKGLMRVADPEDAAKISRIVCRYYQCKMIPDPEPEEGKPAIKPAAPQPTIETKSIKAK